MFFSVEVALRLPGLLSSLCFIHPTSQSYRMKKINGNPKIVEPTDNRPTTKATRIILFVNDFSKFWKTT